MTDTRDSTAIPERARPEKGAGRNPFARLALFVRQVVAELRKVVRPTLQQLFTYWLVVLVFVVVVMTIVALLDQGLTRLMFEVFAGDSK